MIVYSADITKFSEDVMNNRIGYEIHKVFQEKLGHRTSESEFQSWRNSMMYMNNALTQADIAKDAGVAIEFQIPLSSKRVDFILSGRNPSSKDTCVIVELKQWSEIEATEKSSIVKTRVGRGVREMTHPSYQAWTYAAFIEDFNVEVQDSGIGLFPCCYLHNCVDSEGVKSDFYKSDIANAPVFVRNENQEFAQFLRQHIEYGDDSKIIQRINDSELKPRKYLIDHLVSLLNGNPEFNLIDEQKIVYETALHLADKAKSGRKQVLLVDGGPGTGKSVVAVNLLVELTRQELVAQYVTRNTAPREVFQSKLTGSFTKTSISNLFKGAGSYVEPRENPLDALIVDEAHRLSRKSGVFGHLGENQIKEIIRAANFSVFFIDEDQKVILNDIGTREEILEWASKFSADTTELVLESQSRCNGSDGYLSWINHALQLRETANPTLEGIDYDFKVFDNPNELRSEIVNLNNTENHARMVAGYCWDWKSKNDASLMDVAIPEYSFEMQWNLNSDGSLWILKPESIDQIGCIHTCQGLELDYVGVIVGPDFVVRNGEVITDAKERSKDDRSIKGFKKMLQENPEATRTQADEIIKNTYRTLMTRGQKGCYLYCVDQETNEYFKKFVNEISVNKI